MHRIGIYCRLSKAEQKEKESGSIVRQKILLRQWIQQEEKGEIIEYVDDGYSGMTEQRPGYETMLAEVMQGKIDTILVKDFSRLARDYLVLGRLREQFFPAYGVRLISLGDGYDSAHRISQGLTMEIRSIFYEFYSRDISRKVKLALQSRKEAGYYAVAKVPYGYYEKEGKWMIQPDEAKKIQEAFQCAIEGMSYQSIGCKLGFDSARVWYLLHNPVYAGYHVWHKYEKNAAEKNVLLPREQWKLQKNAHPGIVSMEVFEQVQKITEKSQGKKGERHIFSGLTKCQMCGSGLVKARRNKNWLCCRSCTGKEEKRISVEALLEIVAQACNSHYIGRKKQNLFDDDTMEGQGYKDVKVCERMCETIGKMIQQYVETEMNNTDTGIQFKEAIRIILKGLIRQIQVNAQGDVKIYWNFRDANKCSKNT